MKNNQKGTIKPALMVIATAFVIVIYAVLFVLALQFDFAQRQLASERALHIADAGIDYYRWHLIKAPNDYQDGTGVPGPYVHDYKDPQGASIGKFSLDITPPTGGTSTVTVRSTGWVDQYTKVKRTITAKYGKVSLTAFAFATKSDLWFGKSITVNGKVHSNGGIRQDGTNTSTFQSAKETYICDLDTGCTTPQEKPGIWGTGKDASLWEFPVAPIDFDGFNIDFSKMKASAQSDGLYLAPSADQGYHIVFSSDGSFSVYRVTGTNFYKAYSPENGCENLYQIILTETLLATYQVADNDIIFVEDFLWVEGVVNGKTTVAAARFPLDLYNINIWIPNNLTYVDKTGSTNFGLIAENNIVFTRDVPEKFEVNAALLAKNGRVIRHHYGFFGCKSKGPDKMKNEFVFYGSMISDKRSYWNFSSGPKSPASGFVKTILNFDPNIGDDPPGYFPETQFQFVSWKEEKN